MITHRYALLASDFTPIPQLGIAEDYAFIQRVVGLSREIRLKKKVGPVMAICNYLLGHKYVKPMKFSGGCKDIGGIYAIDGEFIPIELQNA